MCGLKLYVDQRGTQPSAGKKQQQFPPRSPSPQLPAAELACSWEPSRVLAVVASSKSSNVARRGEEKSKSIDADARCACARSMKEINKHAGAIQQSPSLTLWSIFFPAETLGGFDACRSVHYVCSSSPSPWDKLSTSPRNKLSMLDAPINHAAIGGGTTQQDPLAF